MYLVFDIGGTFMRVAASPDGTLLETPLVQPTPQDFAEAMKQLTTMTASAHGDRVVQAAAGGIAGVLNLDKTMVAKAPHLPHWQNQDLQASLGEIIQAPIKLENDSALAGLGEAVGGAGKDHDIVVAGAVRFCTRPTEDRTKD